MTQIGHLDFSRARIVDEMYDDTKGSYHDYPLPNMVNLRPDLVNLSPDPVNLRSILVNPRPD